MKARRVLFGDPHEAGHERWRHTVRHAHQHSRCKLNACTAGAHDLVQANQGPMLLRNVLPLVSNIVPLFAGSAGPHRPGGATQDSLQQYATGLTIRDFRQSMEESVCC